jgi:MFS family permease
MVNGRRAIFYTFLTLFMAEALGADFIQLGLVITLPMLTNSFMQAFVWGRVSDRIRRRRLLVVIGECSAGIGYLVIWTSISIWSIIIGLTLVEAIWSMSNTGWASLFADLSLPKERSTIMGRINMLGVVGRLVGITAVGLIYDYPSPSAGFPFVFPIAAAIMFVSVIALVALVPDVHQISQTTDPESPLASTKIPPVHLRNLTFFLIPWAIITIGWTAYLSLFTFFLRLQLNLSSPEISMVRNLNSAIGLISAPIAGYLGDRIGKKPVLLGAFILQAISTLFYGFATNLHMMLIIATLNGAPIQIYHTVGYALAADIIPEAYRGKLFGIYNGVWTISFGGSPTFVGGLFANWRQLTYLSLTLPLEVATIQAIIETFFLSSGIVLVGALLFAIMVRKPKQKVTPKTS